MVAIALCLGMSAQQSVTAQLRAWIYRKLGIDPKVVQSIASVRGGGGRRQGKRVMWVTLKDEQEHLLWACGSCWSPAIANIDDIAVLKSDGIWIVANDAEPRLAVGADGLIDLLGRITNEPDHLLVLQASKAAATICAAVLFMADLRTGALSPVQAAGTACLDTTDLLLYRDQFMGTRVLSNTDRTGPVGPALELLVGDYATSHSIVFAPLTPALNERDSTRDRFNPIWRTRTDVVYLSNP